ncbi:MULTISPECIES: hypothetical protein [unclassified Exiguobacterium]|uniref:hypothetical protein n=1 Tax=unclassified Exiguobacterium TaxID=2644629 RepID=UPI001BE733DB|nr:MULTISPECIES: hypothetical protein [unclassified Exiguobacterium]
MKQYVMKHAKSPLSFQRAVVSDVSVSKDAIRFEFANGIEDRFKERTRWTSRAVVVVPRVDWEESSITRFHEATYDIMPMTKLRDVVKSGCLEIVGELYGENRLLFSCMWLTDTAYLEVEISVHYLGEPIVQWENGMIET